MKTHYHFMRIVLSAMLTWCHTYALYTQSIPKKDYILIINSYTESSEWSNYIIDPVYKDFLSRNSPLTLSTEHMNMLSNITSPEEASQYSKLLLAKYKERPSLILFLGNSAWKILIDDVRRKWGNIPTVLCSEFNFTGPDTAYIYKRPIADENRISLEQFNKGHPLTVVYIPYYIEENLELIHQIMPQLEHLIFISDLRYVGRETRKETRRIMAHKYPQLKVTYLTPTTASIDSLRTRLHTPASHTAALFLSWHIEDPYYRDVLSSGISKVLGSSSAIPLFSLDDEEIQQDGVIGGYYLSREMRGQLTLQAIHQALEGKQKGFSLIQADTPPPSIIYPDLLYFGFTEDSCPKNSIFYLKPLPFHKEHRYIFLGICMGFLLLSTWIIWLSRIRRMQKKQIAVMKDYNTLIENMPIAYIKERLIFSPDGRIQDFIVEQINPYYKTLFGPVEYAEALGRKGSQNKSLTFEKVIRFCNIVYSTQKPMITQFYHSGSQQERSAILSPSSRKGYMDVFCLDTTELIETQKKLRSVNHKLSLALDVANIVPWKWDLTLKTIYYDAMPPIQSIGTPEASNEELLSIPQELYLQSICKADRPRVEQAYQGLIKGTISKAYGEYRIYTRKEGKIVCEWVEVNAVVEERDEHGKPLTLAGSSLVITERKDMENDLISAKLKAEESSRLKSAFVSNMSHEIRTPLNAIVGFSELLSTADSQEEREEYVSIIQNNNTMLLQLIGDILDLSKIEAGTLEFTTSETDLHALFQEIELSALMRNNNPDVEIKYIAEMPYCHVVIERNRVMQVMSNLLNNAMKFTQKGSILFGYRLQENQLYFYVTDTGQGIPADKLASIFRRFVKLNDFSQGAGLGLAICQSLVECMNGRIGVKSVEGEGSTFWFTIPYQPVSLG